jgi:hypothetical protein
VTVARAKDEKDEKDEKDRLKDMKGSAVWIPRSDRRTANWFINSAVLWPLRRSGPSALYSPYRGYLEKKTRVDREGGRGSD